MSMDEQYDNFREFQAGDVLATAVSWRLADGTLWRTTREMVLYRVTRIPGPLPAYDCIAAFVSIVDPQVGEQTFRLRLKATWEWEAESPPIKGGLRAPRPLRRTFEPHDPRYNSVEIMADAFERQEAVIASSRRREDARED